MLIFIHEGGHFVAARICKIKVNEFAIGMGPQIASHVSQKTGIKYAFRLLPIGGFVSMDGEDENSDNPDAFCNKSIPKRMFVVAAGAFMNILLGFILMVALVFSQKVLVSNRIGEFKVGAMSSEKLMVNDVILKVDGTRVHTGNEVAYEIMNKGDKPIEIIVERNNENIAIPDVTFPNFKDSGVVFGNCDFKMYSEEQNFGNYLKHAFYRSVSTVKMIYDSLFNLISGKYGIDSISGPVGVTEVMGEAAKSDVPTLLFVVCVITMNLGVFNLLPFPALDGGRFVFLLIEAIRGKPVNKNVEAYVNFAGLVILFSFMIFVTFKDITKLFKH